MSTLKYVQSLLDFVEDHVSELVSDWENLMYFNELYGSYAISKAEDSALTLAEASHLQLNFSWLSDYATIILWEVNKLNTMTKKYQSTLKKLHDKLEFSNILRVFRKINAPDYIDTWEWPTADRLRKTHGELTRNLDEIFENKLHGYDTYHSWKFRSRDNIVIADKYPMKAERINAALLDILDQTKAIKTLEEAFELHSYLYHIHPFSNGNKRICRILEIILLQKIGINTQIIPPSLGYYRQQDRYIKRLVESSLVRKEYQRFVPFAYCSLLLGILYLLHRELKRRKDKVLKSYNWLVIFSSLSDGERVNVKKLRKHKKLKKIPRRTFFDLLKREKEVVWDLVSIVHEWRNTYYSLNIKDDEYIVIRNKFKEILDIFSEENLNYHNISFLSLR